MHFSIFVAKVRKELLMQFKIDINQKYDRHVLGYWIHIICDTEQLSSPPPHKQIKL